MQISKPWLSDIGPKTLSEIIGSQDPNKGTEDTQPPSDEPFSGAGVLPLSPHIMEPPEQVAHLFMSDSDEEGTDVAVHAAPLSFVPDPCEGYLPNLRDMIDLEDLGEKVSWPPGLSASIAKELISKGNLPPRIVNSPTAGGRLVTSPNPQHLRSE